MGVIFSEDFENAGGPSAFDGKTESGGCTASDVMTVNPKNGTYHMRSTVDGNNEYAAFYEGWSSGSEFWIQAWVYIHDAPTTGEDFRFLCGSVAPGGTGVFYAGIKNDGGTLKWFMRAREGAAFDEYVSAGANPTVDTWYEVRVGILFNSGAGTCALKVDEVSHISESNTDNDDRTLNYFQCGHFYSDAPASGGEIDIDDINVATSEGDLSWTAGGDVGMRGSQLLKILSELIV